MNTVFNCSKSLLSSSLDKATTGTYNLVSVILNVASVGLLITATAGSASGPASHVALLAITQFSDQGQIRFISQLIYGISGVFQKLFKCFNSTTISTSFSALLPSNLPVMLEPLME